MKTLADQMHQVFVLAQDRGSHLFVEYKLIAQDNNTIKLKAADVSPGNPRLGNETFNFTVDQPFYHLQRGVVGNTDQAWQLFVNELLLTRSYQTANALAKQIRCRINRVVCTIIQACFQAVIRFRKEQVILPPLCRRQRGNGIDFAAFDIFKVFCRGSAYKPD